MAYRAWLESYRDRSGDVATVPAETPGDACDSSPSHEETPSEPTCDDGADAR